jgi:hypothetical protein
MDTFDGRATPDSTQGFFTGQEEDQGNQTEGNTDRDGNGGQNRKDYRTDRLPPWSELKTKAGKERKRLPLACIACRRKKIRCSGEKPACKHCLRARIPCVYKVTTRKATPRTDYMAMLDKRLKRMEDRVIKLIPKDNDAASIPRAVVKPALPAPPPKPPKPAKKRAAEEAFGTEGDIESWARGDQNVGQGDSHTHPMKRTDTDERSLLTEGVEYLPPADIQQHLTEVYFDYVYGQSYPLLHKPTFMRKLAAGTVPPVLILAVCAISARFSNHPQLQGEPAFLRGEDWAAPAREIALKRYDSPNITILIVYLLLGLNEFGTCQGGRSWMLGGMAQRMVFVLQLHKDRDRSHHPSQSNDETTNMSPTEREIRRRVMWSCFLMDRFNSSGTDRPICIPEECIAVPLPVKERLFLLEVEGITETIDGKVPSSSVASMMDTTGRSMNAASNMSTSAYLIRLVAIWGRIVKYFNLGGREAAKLPMWHPSSQFQNITESLRQFNRTLPDEMRWSQDNLAAHKVEKTDNHFVFMHMVFQHLQLFTHRFALPASGFRVPREIPQSFLTESARMALEAANQVSVLAKEASIRNVTAPFAGYAAFYASTVHIQGVFAKNPQIVERAKENLAINVKFLARMKRWWGMFHFVTENLKELYRTHANAALARSSGRHSSHKDGKPETSIFQYGDWFDRYPSGVSRTDYEDPAKKCAEDDKVDDGVLGAKEKNLLSVEEFFIKLEGESPGPNETVSKRRSTKKAKVAAATKEIRPILDRLDTTNRMLQGSNTHIPPRHQQPDLLHQQPDLLHQQPDLLHQQPQSPNVMAIPMDSGYGSGTPFLQTAHPMANFDMNLMAAQQTPTTPNASGLGDVWGFDFTHISNMNGFPQSSAVQNTEWYMPWNMETPVGFDGSFNGIAVGEGMDGLGLIIDGMGGMRGNNES